MPEFLEKITRAIKEHEMAAPGDTVLAAVSGGPDSMAMLHALHELSGTLGISLAAAHLDHGLRPDSADDAAFVEAAAANLGLECVTGKADPATLRGPGINTQQAARHARYGFFEAAADRLGARRVAVAHTVDDQAETYLMRLLRGSGAHGLASIPPVRGRVVRPLIEASRADVLDYLGRRGVGYRTDPTNLKTDYLRNRLRLELMPKLEECNPNIAETLARGAGLLRDEDGFLDALAGEAMRGLALEDRGWLLTLEREGLAALHPALARRVARLAVGRLKGGLGGVGFGHVEDALSLVRSGGTGRGVDLPGGVRAELSYGAALFYRPADKPGDFRALLDVPGSVEIPELGISVEAVLAGAGETPADGPAASACFDESKAAGPLVVRRRRPGDFFYPSGMRGKKKLKEFFIDMKTPRLERDTTPVLECRGDIMWVMGIRADARFEARGAAGALCVTLRKSGPR